MTSLSMIFLQLTSTGSVGEVFFRAATATIDTSVAKCLVIMPLALFMHLMIVLTKAYFGDMRIDISPLLKVILIWILLAGYTELVSAIYDATLYLAGIFGDPSTSILESLNKISDNSYLKQHSTSLAFTDVRIPFDDGTSFMTWLMLTVENGLALIIRLFIERIRVILLAYVVAAGPIAFTIATIPGFGGTFLHWIRVFIATSLWSLTLSILDAIMNAALPTISIPTGSAISEVQGVLDMLILNGAVVLMYLSVPLLTSYYIGGSSGVGAGLRAAQGYMGAGLASASNYAVSRYQNFRNEGSGNSTSQQDSQRDNEVNQSNQVPGND